MISHLSDCIEKKYMVGYGGLLTWIFKKFGVPLECLHFSMSSNNKIGVKCLTNLHLKLTNKGILESTSTKDVEEEGSVGGDQEKEEEKEKEGQREDEQDKEAVPAAVHEKAEDGSKSEQEEVQGMGEQQEAMSEGEPSPIPFTPPPTTATPASPHPHTSLGLGFPAFSNPSSVLTAALDPILTKLKHIQSQFYSIQDEVRVTLASITNHLTKMKARLGAKLDTVEVQIEYVDKEDNPTA